MTKLTETEREARRLIRKCCVNMLYAELNLKRRDKIIAQLKERGTKNLKARLREGVERLRANEARKREERERYYAMSVAEREQWHAQKWEQERAKWRKQLEARHALKERPQATQATRIIPSRVAH
jgi:hypothetical protein